MMNEHDAEVLGLSQMNGANNEVFDAGLHWICCGSWSYLSRGGNIVLGTPSTCK